jgi:CheY-like chemotaxis protein
VAARRPRVLLAGVLAISGAVARVAVGDRIDVEEAPHGESLIDTVRDNRPDLVILDWNAPGQPAREVVAALRADAVARDAKVLLLVEHKQTSSGDVAAAGADDRLAAPFSPLQLQVKLRRLLGADAVGG